MSSAESPNSPCAACMFLRRKCTQGCVFSPCFPPDQPKKFASVHRVFGASNVAKLLNEISPPYREDAVNSLAYEAEARLRDPVYGCVGYISMLRQKIKAVQHDLFTAKKELATYIGPAALGPFLPPLNSSFGSAPFHQQQQQGFGHMGMTPQQQMILREQQQQIIEEQQLVLLRSMQQQQEINNRFNINNGRFVDGRGFINQVDDGDGDGVGGGDGVASGSGASPLPGLVLVVSPRQQFDNSFNVQQAQQLQLHQNVEQQQMQQQHRRTGSDEGRSGIGPASSLRTEI